MKKVTEDPLIYSFLIIILVFCFVSTAKAAPSPLIFPDTITVRITGYKECKDANKYVLAEIPFKDYVKGVLSNEWGMDWNEESLKAGAVAVKMYGWSAVERGGNWIDTMVFYREKWQPGKILEGGKWIDAHVYDCDWDQVYDPRVHSDAVDKAVDDTWEYILVNESGNIVRTYFNAWINGCYEQQEENCLGQWDSLKDAENGMNWKEIITKYYEGELICPRCFIDAPAFPPRFNISEFELCR